jgi:hypothetical protein
MTGKFVFRAGLSVFISELPVVLLLPSAESFSFLPQSLHELNVKLEINKTTAVRIDNMLFTFASLQKSLGVVYVARQTHEKKLLGQD